MFLSHLPALTVFAAVALGVAGFYLAIASGADVCRNLFRLIRRKQAQVYRPGEHIHLALKLTGRRWVRLRTSGVLFVVTFLVLFALGQRGWWVDLSAGSFAIVAVLLGLIPLYGAIVLLQLYRYRVKLSRALHLHNAVAQRLGEVQMRGNRLHHSIPVADSVIDHIVVGGNGVYAIQIFKPPSRRVESVAYSEGGLRFEPGGEIHDWRRFRKSVVELTKALSQLVGLPVTVMPVMVIPDCRIESMPESGPLLVSLESCTSFVGWKDQRAFLMDDDADKINAWLLKQTITRRPKNLRELGNRIGAHVPRPAFS